MKDKASQVAFRMSFAYWAISVLWILLSERALLWISRDPSVMSAISLYKGWGFVTFTAALLYATLRGQLRKWETEAATRRQAEEALRQSEIRFSKVFDASPVAIGVWRLRDLVYLDVNDAFLETFGYSRSEVLHHRPEELGIWPAAERAPVIREVHRKKRLQNIEARGYHRSGRTREFLVSLETIDLNGETCIVELVTDISERKKSEQELQESEERYRSLFENNPSIMLLIDPHTADIADANPAACSFYGYSREEMRRLKITDINRRASGQVLAEMQQAGSGQQNRFTFQHQLAGGNQRDVEVYSGPIPLRGKSLLYSIVHDITDRRLAEKALVESLENYQTLSHTIPFGVQVVDLSGTILFTNGRPLPGPPESITGRKCWEVYKDDGRQCLDCPLHGGALPGNTSAIEVTGVAGGRVFQIHHTGMTYGGTPAVLEIFQDITERRHLEEALRRQATLIDLSPDAILCRTPEGTITFWSKGAEKMYGWTGRDAIGKSTYDLLRTSFPEGLEPSPGVLRAAGQWTGELTHTTRDGHTLTVESRWLHEPGRDELMESNVDITERKKAEEQVERSLHEKELLLKEVHHRVKNNMQIISSMLRLQSRAVNDPVAQAMLEECQNRIRSMSLIHEQLYSTSDLTRISQHEYVERLTQNLLHSFVSRDGRVRIDLGVDPRLSLDLDTAIPCGLIINELVSNALKHAFPGKRAGVVHVGFREADPAHFELVISDDGVGLPENLNIDRSQTLGLQLVQSLVKELHGSMGMEVGAGTAFRITFGRAEYGRRI